MRVRGRYNWGCGELSISPDWSPAHSLSSPLTVAPDAGEVGGVGGDVVL